MVWAEYDCGHAATRLKKQRHTQRSQGPGAEGERGA
jgi:hypothetical protein